MYATEYTAVSELVLCSILKTLFYTNWCIQMFNRIFQIFLQILDADDCRFRVESKQKALELQATSEEEKEDWMKVSRFCTIEFCTR